MVMFELAVLLLAVGIYLLLHNLDDNLLPKALYTFIGVLLFEYFTQALWLNTNLEWWAYLYLDVSWIIGIGWTTIILAARTIVESNLPGSSEIAQYIYSLIVISIIGFFAEAAVVALGIRQYPQSVVESLSGVWLGGVPIEAVYYIPVFMALVVAFSHYWEAKTGVKA